MPSFGMLVPLWPGSRNVSWHVIEADNCDEAWKKAKTLNPAVEEIVNLRRCDMGNGLLFVLPTKNRGIEGLKKGDEVVVRTTWMSDRDNVVSKVARITESGKIRLEDGRLFNADGIRIEPGWGRFVLYRKGVEPK